MRAPSSLTFGSRSSSGSVEDADTLFVGGLPPVFARGHARNRLSLLPDRRAVAEAQSEQYARDASRAGVQARSACLAWVARWAAQRGRDTRSRSSMRRTLTQIFRTNSRSSCRRRGDITSGRYALNVSFHPPPVQCLAALAWSPAACTVAYLTFALPPTSSIRQRGVPHRTARSQASTRKSMSSSRMLPSKRTWSDSPYRLST
ncbi:hypothetical protein B0H14DRAFT_458563 [Mycena olivaceomarginata]|nr:hypothetical protein B0H14DRAFT_458563 [Mycena olivaceomarginata]